MFAFNKVLAKKWVGTCPPSSYAPACLDIIFWYHQGISIQYSSLVIILFCPQIQLLTQFLKNRKAIIEMGPIQGHRNFGCQVLVRITTNTAGPPNHFDLPLALQLRPYLNNYFNFHVCLSICLSVFLSFLYPCVSPISTSNSFMRISKCHP